MSEETKPALTSDLPKPPKVDDFKDADSFKAAIRDWAGLHEIAYAKLYPASNRLQPPPDPGAEPVMPSGPPEPERASAEDREAHGKRLTEWLPKQEEWFFKEYLSWEITRTKWYVARNTLRDWEALRKLEIRQRVGFRQSLLMAILRFAALGLVTGGVVLAGLKLFG
jgi:hypothetical protein